MTASATTEKSVSEADLISAIPLPIISRSSAAAPFLRSSIIVSGGRPLSKWLPMALAINISDFGSLLLPATASYSYFHWRYVHAAGASVSGLPPHHELLSSASFAIITRLAIEKYTAWL